MGPAAALRFHQTLTARLQAHTLLWNYKMMKNNSLRAALLQEELAEDLSQYTTFSEKMLLQPWMKLTLGPYRTGNFWDYLGSWLNEAKLWSAEWDTVKDTISTHCASTCFRRNR